MPTNRTKRSRGRTRAGELTDGQEQFLLFGHAFFDDHPFSSEAECKKAWFRHREKWIANAKFSRPWSWWCYDAPEMRQIVQGSDEKAIKNRKYKGQWSCWNCSCSELPIYESELEYLVRLGLLNQNEKELLKDMERA